MSDVSSSGHERLSFSLTTNEWGNLITRSLHLLSQKRERERRGEEKRLSDLVRNSFPHWLPSEGFHTFFFVLTSFVR